MENWINKGNKEQPFFYIKIALLSDDEKIKYSVPSPEYRVYLTVPDRQYTGEVEALLDKNFNIMDVRCTTSRFPQFFDMVTQYKDKKAPVSSLLLELRKLYEVKYGSEPRPDYSHR